LAANKIWFSFMVNGSRGAAMNFLLKTASLTFSLLLVAQSIAQELHTFSNGEVADADKINENFQYLLNNNGGCSAAQDGSSVIITCADGSSGVLASAGTVVMVSEASSSAPVTQSYNTGEIVWQDGAEVTLGRASFRSEDGGTVPIVVEGRQYDIGIYNDHSEQVVKLTSSTSMGVFFLEDDCKGLMFMLGYVAKVGNEYFVPDPNQGSLAILSKSNFSVENFYTNFNPQGNCRNQTQSVVVTAAMTFIPPHILLDAAYPIQAVQLP
jgi:hypothetical protein